MPKIFMASLGCAKNLVDAEIMLGETLGEEYSLELDPAAADVIIINTCGFIQEARNEARAVIGDYLEIKKKSDHPIKVVAMGCWAERWPEEVAAEFPGLDAVWGLNTASSLRLAIRDLTDGGGVSGVGTNALPREGARLLTTPASFAYLRISDGCDNRCHYCAIPLIRGGLRSLRPESILKEAEILEAQGVKELVIISQDTTAYGQDLRRPDAHLAGLLKALLKAVSVPRLRVLYAHPAHLDEETCELLLSEPRLCRYLDLPIQHIADGVLRGMGRGYDGARVRALLDRFSDPAFTLRTTLLLGFPGESEEDFRQALALVREGRFHHLGAFAYSPERDTPAARLPGQIPAGEAERRRDAILEAQREVAFDWLDSRIGKREKVLIDSRIESGWLVGRTRREAPDADGVVYVRDGKARPGEIIETCIKHREDYDLLAEGIGPKRRR